MQRTLPVRRSYGTGQLYVRTDANGRETYYGRWRDGGRRINRRIGPKRPRGSGDGLTRTQAEERLREMIDAHCPAQTAPGLRLTVGEAGGRYRLHAERRGRKPSTISNLESEMRVHVEPFFAGRNLDAITAQDVADFVAHLEAKRLSAKSIRNVVASLSAVCNFAKSPRRRWLTVNPCDGVELPAVPEGGEVRFLTLEEIERLIEHTREGMFHALDRALYRTAAMTGLRRGELLALRWQDVDWLAQRIRVRRNYVRGSFGTPKSKRSIRSVPMAVEAARELERLYQASPFQADQDLVFAHPVTGQPLYVAGISRRMSRALKAAKLDPTHRFHDLRHTFGTQCAAAGVPMRTLQEWMGHKDIKTTQIYADYQPSNREADMIAAAFARPGETPPAESNRGGTASAAALPFNPDD